MPVASPDIDTEAPTAPSIPDPTLDTQDRDKFTHIVIGGQPAILDAMLNGNPCFAFCGKVWVPSSDPANYPLCKTCEEECASYGYRVPNC